MALAWDMTMVVIVVMIIKNLPFILGGYFSFAISPACMSLQVAT